MASLITKDQAQAADILLTAIMKVIAMVVAFCFLAVGLGVFIYTVFYMDSVTTQVVSGTLEATFGVMTREMYKGLFGGTPDAPSSR